MSTFSQWWKSFRKEPSVKRYTWLCGPEVVLVEEIVTDIRKLLKPEPWDNLTFVVGEDSERLLWEELAQYPVGFGNRLIVVRNAEAIEETHRLVDFLRNSASNPRTFLVLVSNEDSVRRVEVEDHKWETVDFLQVNSRGQVVECKPFTQATAKHAVAWVQSKVKMRDGIAGYLLDRADGDLRLVRDLCQKLALFEGEITLQHINEILSERPRDSLVDALIALDKKTAIQALSITPEDDYGRIIGLLDAQVDFAGIVHDMMVEYKSASEIARAVGNRAFLVPDVMRVARHYNKEQRITLRNVLAEADEAYRGGIRESLMESVIARW